MDDRFDLLWPNLPTRRNPQGQLIFLPRAMMALHQRGIAVEPSDLILTTSSASEQARDQVLLRVDSITKQYADQAVLTEVSFDIQAGEILGIIGPNGAGKTTLLEAVAGILPIDKGNVRWRGKPLPSSRRREAIFFLPDGVRPYQEQSVTKVLSFFAGVYREIDQRDRECNRIDRLDAGSSKARALAFERLQPQADVDAGTAYAAPPTSHGRTVRWL